MTRYYLYVKAGVRIDAGTRFYKVGIGESDQQERVRAWLAAYAAENGHFFVLWSVESAAFFVKCCQSLAEHAPCLVPCNGAQLRRWLQNGDDVSSLMQAELHRHRLLMQIDPNYYTVSVLRSKKLDL